MSRIVFTGSCCTGKTTVFDMIEGAVVVSETARTWLNIVQGELFKDYKDEEFFQKLIEVNQIKDWIENPDAFFDRSIVDEIAYREYFGMPISNNLLKVCHECRYDKIFYFPFWEEIFVNDLVRTETLEQAKVLDQLLIDAYQTMGYNLIMVPKTSPKERLKFILDNLK